MMGKTVEAAFVVAIGNERETFLWQFRVAVSVEVYGALRHEDGTRAAKQRQPFQPGVNTAIEWVLWPSIVEHRVAKIRNPRQACQPTHHCRDQMSGRDGVSRPDYSRAVLAHQ